MQIKSYPCHGLVIDRTTLRKGEFINDRVMASNNFSISGNKIVRDDSALKQYWWFMESGHNTHENSMGVVTDQTFGWSNKDNPMADGDYLLSVKEACVVWCFNETANDTLPDFDFQVVSSGDTWGFQDGAKVFLMSGSFTVDGKTVTGPRQLVVSGNKSVTFTADAMFIILRD